MKAKHIALAVIVSLLPAGGVRGALTTIVDSPDIYDEPNLIGMNPYAGNLNPSVLESLYGEANVVRNYPDNGIGKIGLISEDLGIVP
jgi:hypothetical protein